MNPSSNRSDEKLIVPKSEESSDLIDPTKEEFLEAVHDPADEAAIKAGSERTSMPYPGADCSFESALRWAANARKVDFKILRRAFANYLETRFLSDEDAAKLKAELESSISKSDAREIKKRLKRNEKAKNFRSSFIPGKSRAPRGIAADVKQIMVVDWEGLNSVGTKQLADLATNFRPFWDQYASEYKELAKAKSSRNRRSGRGGPDSRMFKKWVRRTEDFVRTFADQLLPNGDVSKGYQCIAEFSQMQSEKKRTQKKISGFIKTLYSDADKPATDDLIQELIKLVDREGIKAADSDTIRRCLEELQPLRIQPPWKRDSSNSAPL